ncbi:MAG: hypothetical protein A2758_00525 [Candidatus Zambryskibacteria bacterium RIFCSPHIGHO2_01_FULL_49_18]|uniref:Uncharacterized protein n=2 Tax=Candidatus Zambryskiibacteriota TaxID=1817925 RepID=A0A1G2T4R0_9BACT|nr:MAG: hypothetical protein A2758_00525 [Candidatus Zambryskibacteria bacterium RIFCSPHIGHO2_01_FULL_49_18]OHB05909.1 MAG: hypothetical protein A3A26_03110 [Candidatus Zambryskibacteria bacterium RIFCSPLOWO2_01_FULL_47_14]
MKGISDLLKRISSVLNQDEELKRRIIELIREKTNIKLPKENIFLKNGVLEIDASPAAKNEIKLKEDEIKKEFKIFRILYK